ncbi:hypothetical protein JW930_07765 [Candidatus Woesearchaeota archaeon]|nr:hypothetical protein [Candidatus Woesearchaeota archaeon]
MSETKLVEPSEWVKLVFNETPTKVNVKQGYLYDEGDFYKVIGDFSVSYVRKSNVISITKKRRSPAPGFSRKNSNKKGEVE